MSQGGLFEPCQRCGELDALESVAAVGFDGEAVRVCAECADRIDAELDRMAFEADPYAYFGVARSDFF